MKTPWQSNLRAIIPRWPSRSLGLLLTKHIDFNCLLLEEGLCDVMSPIYNGLIWSETTMKMIVFNLCFLWFNILHSLTGNWIRSHCLQVMIIVKSSLGIYLSRVDMTRHYSKSNEWHLNRKQLMLQSATPCLWRHLNSVAYFRTGVSESSVKRIFRWTLKQ